MSYASDHLAWQQRVFHEKSAAFKFKETNRAFGQVGDYYNYVIDTEQKVNEQNKMMPVYKAPLMSPQNNSKRLGSATRRLQLTDRNGTAIDPQNYFTSQTPRITMNKQAYTFGK